MDSAAVHVSDRLLALHAFATRAPATGRGARMQRVPA
jgi:hypothetical protein